MKTEHSNKLHDAGTSTHPYDNRVQRLGTALGERVASVSEGIARRSAAAGVDAAVEAKFQDVGAVSTRAVARWMAGEGEDVAREVGGKAWQVFAHLAARREVPLNEVTKRCLRWRDSVDETLADCAEEKGLRPEVLACARQMLQRSLDVTLVRVCEAFEEERQAAQLELDRHQRELEFLATHDPLTRLPNRTLIADRIEQKLGAARERMEPVAALFVDLDNFKAINDSLGHNVGDELLCAVAERLRRVIRESDAVGRLGGDEFVVVADGASLAAGPELIAERILEAFQAPFRLMHTNEEVSVPASIGIATRVRGTAERLLDEADAAMLQAKRRGKNRFRLFENDMHEDAKARSQLEIDLRGALERGEFELFYQPLFDLEEMNPVAVEALLRWRRPEIGLIAATDFVPLLEDTGIIVEVGGWVLATACSQCAGWQVGGDPVGLSVNVSAVQLEDGRLVDDVREALEASDMDARRLTLELTETALMNNVDETLRRLSELKRLGVRIAIDDFGTGYSSLAYLRQFPVDALKIDRSFVSKPAPNGTDDEVLLRSLVKLGKDLSMKTTAEGIERERDLQLVRSEACDLGQGFLLNRPLSADAAGSFFAGWPDSADEILDQIEQLGTTAG